MSVTEDRAAYIDETLRTVVVPHLTSTLRQLHDWMADHSPSTSDAPPDSSGGPGRLPPPRVGPDGEELEEEASMSRQEQNALTPDRARKVRREMADAQVRLIESQQEVLDRLGVGWPAPDMRRAPARAAWMAWAAKQTRTFELGPSFKSALRHQVLQVDVLRRACSTYRPPDKFVISSPFACVSHARIGVVVEVVDRFKGLRLCNWCGEHRDPSGALPHADLVKIFDRHGRVSPKQMQQHRRRIKSGRTFEETIERRAAQDRRDRLRSGA